jgi:signal transduction histidine kinase
MSTTDTSDLEISRFELHKVADFLPYPFIIAEVIDGIHYNTYLNEKFLLEIGYTLEEIPTIEKWYEHAYPDQFNRDRVISAWEQEQIKSQNQGKVFVKNKSQVVCKNGTKRWYEIKASVIDKIHVVAFIDLDKEIILQEELKSINQNNDRMLSVLGHDLRSPIANLTSISEMALDNEISQGEFVNFIHLINNQSNQVLEMLETTLNWAKLNFNSIQQNDIDIDVKTLITTILDLYETTYKSKEITVNIDIDESNTIHSDIEIVTVIVRNIISNAIKFTPQNGMITIKFTQNQLTVIDNGIGMTEAMINAIWNSNYASRRGTDNEIGMGMGMQLVLNLSRKIKAAITIQSELSKGTSIVLIF